MKSTQLKHQNHKIECQHQGAHLSSWHFKGKEQIFLSESAKFEQGVALRGGAPICFPQFAAFGPGKKHGFARNIDWQLESQTENTLTFLLSSTEETRALWHYSFYARFRVEIDDNALSMTLEVENLSDETFIFTSALHTYFKISDIHAIQIAGLNGLEYWDNGTPFIERQRETHEHLQIGSAIDRVYFDAPETLKLIEDDQIRQITSEGFSDVVVWNPWLEGAQALSDMADQEYLNMICIEAANIEKPAQVKPGKTWSGTQKIVIT